MKRQILKINTDGTIEIFTTLPRLFENYPEIKKHKDNIDTYFSRLKKDFVKGDYTLRNVEVNQKCK